VRTSLKFSGILKVFLVAAVLIGIGSAAFTAFGTPANTSSIADSSTTATATASPASFIWP